MGSFSRERPDGLDLFLLGVENLKFVIQRENLVRQSFDGLGCRQDFLVTRLRQVCAFDTNVGDPPAVGRDQGDAHGAFIGPAGEFLKGVDGDTGFQLGRSLANDLGAVGIQGDVRDP